MTEWRNRDSILVLAFPLPPLNRTPHPAYRAWNLPKGRRKVQVRAQSRQGFPSLFYGNHELPLNHMRHHRGQSGIPVPQPGPAAGCADLNATTQMQVGPRGHACVRSQSDRFISLLTRSLQGGRQLRQILAGESCGGKSAWLDTPRNVKISTDRYSSQKALCNGDPYLCPYI
jgi:hypothetical protein